ncbi:hypothetical protein [Bacillus thuringiensis]|uniref:hypothetical protein n=1 Tax=Bacillus thuringiensis TaxID=1428 RepID=UPI003A8BE19D
MNKGKKDLFTPIVPEKKLGNGFRQLTSNINMDEPTRNMMNEVFSCFPDSDGNFVEQFQTTGFDARIFELYLYAYFQNSGYEIDRNFDRPDFIIQKNGLRVAVEATTTNPTAGKINIDNQEELTKEKLEYKLTQELPIKFGSPLFSKLQKRYWELEHCKEIPFVLAIEAFHESSSLEYSSSSLIQYLYGERDKGYINEEGKLVVEQEKIYEHKVGDKKIPSGFFYQPNVENISAIIFSNSGTTAKFKRMGYQKGLYTTYMKVMRRGFAYDYNPNALSPEGFVYDLDERSNESWGEGLVVCLNPNAKYPLPHNFFIDAAQYYKVDDKTVADIVGFHPYNSQTFTFCSEYEKEIPPQGVRTLYKSELNDLVSNLSVLPFATEREWYVTLDYSIIGLILFDEIDKTWNYVCLEKKGNQYEAVSIEIDFKELSEVRSKLFGRMLSAS